MRALVTGGCGFIGSNLTKRLVDEGWTVDVVDNLSGGLIESLDELSVRQLPNASFIEHFYSSMHEAGKTRLQKDVLLIPDDLASDPMLRHISLGYYDIVFHQAAVPRVSYSVENPGHTTFENTYKTVELFKACAGNVKRVVWASSSSVYGGATLMPTPEGERGKVLPKSPYAWQKFSIEDFAVMCSDLYDLDVVCLRYFNVFGPGQQGDSPYSTAVSAWCHAIKNGLPLRSDGDGEQTRDLCYVDNTVQANILAATASRVFNGRCYNIACGDRTSNNEILDYFKSNFNIEVEHAPERQGDVKHTQADINRAESELGYTPNVKFWEGLKRTIEWWDLDDNSQF
jgi:UDP-glucose 4-epimerase